MCRRLDLVDGRLQNGQRFQGLILNVHKVIGECHSLLFVAGAGRMMMVGKCMIVERHQLVVLVPVVVVHVLVLEILRGDVLQRLARLVIMMNVLGDRVRVLVVTHLQRDVDFDVLATNSERHTVNTV